MEPFSVRIIDCVRGSPGSGELVEFLNKGRWCEAPLAHSAGDVCASVRAPASTALFISPQAQHLESIPRSLESDIIEDQSSLGSCTAHAGIGVVEYFERKAFGRHTDASRLFLYKVTRNLLGQTGDTGAFLRTTMEAMVLFGVPPEEYWRYDIADFDKEPSAFLYAFAQNYQAISYYRLDPPATSREVLLSRIKTFLAAGLPSMFGFTVYSSIEKAEKTGRIPFPVRGEKVLGGHAVVAVGYDDAVKIISANPAGGSAETEGALLIRNSWGARWGEQGYGWLPYKYVLDGLAVDWWSLLKNEWVDTGMFKG